jgi:hypothetical protein
MAIIQGIFCPLKSFNKHQMLDRCDALHSIKVLSNRFRSALSLSLFYYQNKIFGIIFSYREITLLCSSPSGRLLIDCVYLHNSAHTATTSSVYLPKSHRLAEAIAREREKVFHSRERVCKPLEADCPMLLF